jgi:diguanylate cyclase (GGDEF)-like protein/PAS domain S-box-containing protein
MTPATDHADAPDTPVRVLLIEDNPGDARLIVRQLERIRDTVFDVETTDRIAAGTAALMRRRFDLVLLDLSLPDSRGIETLDLVLQCGLDVPVVVLTGLDDDTLALEALRRGAQDYVVKGQIDWRMLKRTVRYATERSQAAAIVRAADARFKLMFEQSPVGFVFSDLDGRILQTNQAFLKLGGFAEQDLAKFDVWSLLCQPGQTTEPLAPRREGRGGPIEMELRHACGELIPVSITWAVVDDRTGDPRIWLTFEDLSHYKVIEQRLLQLSMYDALTGLANRNLFHTGLVKALARAERSGRGMALLMLDLDGFKQVNDKLGHDAGDSVLRTVAQRLNARLRSADQVARIGGDEFAVILENVDRLSDAAIVARKIIAAITPPFELAGQEIHCGVSIGIAGWPEHPEAMALRRAADLAMYAAKNAGGNAYRFYSDTIRTEFEQRGQLEQELRRAREADAFTLHYQPQIDLVTGRIRGAEALLRWQHPERGLLCAGEFIEGLESSGEIQPVGDWVFETALAQLEHWDAIFGKDLSLAINLSPRQLARDALLPQLVHALARHSIDPARLELELAESTVASKSECDVLAELHALGLRITVDDFGRGYSSLQYLKLLPVQALKIDHAFVHGVPAHTEDVAIVSATLALGRTLGLEVIGKGVETQAQLEFLRARGCSRAQGHFLGKPVSPEAFETLLQARAAIA